MLIHTIDGETMAPAVTLNPDGSFKHKGVFVDDNRIASMRHFFAQNPGILGFGAWSQYGAKDDNAALAFAIPQLAFLEKKVFARKYQPLKHEELLGSVIDYSAGPGRASIQYQVIDAVGQGRRVSGRGNDIPKVDVAAAMKSFRVEHGGLAYDFTTQELRASAYLQAPLPDLKLKAAIVGFRQHMNLVALQGEIDFQGLFNNSLVPEITRPSGSPWASATANTIISDFITAMATVKINTADTDVPTKVVMPIATEQLLLQPSAIGSGAGTSLSMSIKEYLQKIYPQVSFHTADELKILGNGGVNRMVFFNPIDENMVDHIPMTQQFLAPQLVNLEINVPSEYEYAGLEIRRPLTVLYMDGV